MDFLFLPLMECDLVRYILYNVSESEKFKSIDQQYNSLYADLKRIFGMSFNMTAAFMLYDNVLCDLDDGKYINAQLTEAILSELNKLTVDFWKHYVFADERVRKICNTHMFGEWIKIMNNVVEADKR